MVFDLKYTWKDVHCCFVQPWTPSKRILYTSLEPNFHLWIVRSWFFSSGDEQSWESSLTRGMSILGVSLNGGTPKWMVKIMEHPMKFDDLGCHYFRKHPYISRNLDGSKAKLRNTRSPCRSIHRHTETEVKTLFSGMCWGAPVIPNLREVVGI